MKKIAPVMGIFRQIMSLFLFLVFALAVNAIEPVVEKNSNIFSSEGIVKLMSIPSEFSYGDQMTVINGNLHFGRMGSYTIEIIDEDLNVLNSFEYPVSKFSHSIEVQGEKIVTYRIYSSYSFGKTSDYENACEIVQNYGQDGFENGYRVYRFNGNSTLNADAVFLPGTDPIPDELLKILRKGDVDRIIAKETVEVLSAGFHLIEEEFNTYMATHSDYDHYFIWTCANRNLSEFNHYKDIVGKDKDVTTNGKIERLDKYCWTKDRKLSTCVGPFSRVSDIASGFGYVSLTQTAFNDDAEYEWLIPEISEQHATIDFDLEQGYWYIDDYLDFRYGTKITPCTIEYKYCVISSLQAVNAVSGETVAKLNFPKPFWMECTTPSYVVMGNKRYLVVGGPTDYEFYCNGGDIGVIEKYQDTPNEYGEYSYDYTFYYFDLGDTSTGMRMPVMEKTVRVSPTMLHRGDILNVSGDGINNIDQVDIVSLDGITRTHRNINANSVSINTNDLPAGMHIVNVKQSNTISESTKIVVK